MFVKDVRLQIALTLGAIAVISLIRFFSLTIFLSFIISLVGTLLIESLFLYFTKKKIFLSYSAIITGLLIFLIWQSDSLWTYLLAAVLAISSKYILKLGPKHIFNPAAFGLLTSSIITGTPVAWWGASWNILLILILYIGTLPVLKRLRRLYIVGGFLLFYFIFSILTTQNIQTIQFLIDGTVILFALIMLPEPQTSPISGHWLKKFGVYVALIMIVLINVLKYLPNINIDPLLLSLLIGDLLSVLLIKLQSRPITIPPPTQNVS